MLSCSRQQEQAGRAEGGARDIKRRWLVTLVAAFGVGAALLAFLRQRTPLYELDDLLESTDQLLLEGRDEQIVRLCSRYLAAHPDCAEAYYERAVARQGLERHAGALKDLDRAIQFGPDLASAYSSRASVREHAGRYEQADRDHEKAIALALAAAQAEPESAEAHYVLGRAYAYRGEYDHALESLSKAVELDPDDVHARVLRGWVHGRKGEPERELADLGAAIRMYPRAAVAYQERASIHFDQGDYDQAIEAWDRALWINGRFGEAYGGRGLAYETKGEYGRALADYTRAIRTNGRSAWAYAVRGRLRYLALEPEARPEWADRSDWLYWVYFSRQHRRGMRDLNKALELDPRMAMAHYYRGLLEWMRGQKGTARDEWRSAVELLTESIEAEPDDVCAYSLRACCYSGLEGWQSARTDWEKVVELDPDGPEGQGAARSLRWLNRKGY